MAKRCVYKYETLYQKLLSSIRAGDLKPGDRVPSQRDLMTRYHYSCATVTSALRRLQRENIIVRRRGRGGSVVKGLASPRYELSPDTTFGVFCRNVLSCSPGGYVKGLYDAAIRERVALDFIVIEDERRCIEKCQRIVKGEAPLAGVLIPYLPGYESAVAIFKKAAFPYVVIQAPILYPGLTQLLQDHRKAAAEAVLHLIKHDHERIALLHGSNHPQDAWDTAKVEGYKAALATSGLPCKAALIRRVRDNVEAADRELAQFIQEAQFTALFTTTGRIGLGAVECLKRCGKRIPGDIAVVSFDVILEEKLSQPDYDISGMHVPFVEMGEEAVIFLKQLLQKGPAKISRHREVPIPFIRRTSCGCVA